MKKIAFVSFLIALSLCANEAQDWQKMQPLVPRGYVCYRAATPIEINGKIDDPQWNDAPWSDEFVDIEGPVKPAPRFKTRMKMLWNDEYLYIAAELLEPHVNGFITQKNAVMFHDNDFEVFLDPDGDNHNYHEFEMNALNTIWELDLTKPYKDGGKVLNGTNLEGLKSAVHVNGTINDPSDIDTGWTLEIAFPLKEMAKYNSGGRDAAAITAIPRDGDQWRIGFSRVEWRYKVEGGKYVKEPNQAENNWIWSAQGIIDMHRPERWGFLQFSTAPTGTAKYQPDPTLPARDALMEIYHYQKDFFSKNKKYAQTAAELGLEKSPAEIRMTDNGYEASLRTPTREGGEKIIRTRQDSMIWMEK